MTAPTPKRLAGRQERLLRKQHEAWSVQRVEASERRPRKPRRPKLPADLEAQLQARSGGRCELCGGPFRDRRCHRHHRKLRGQGGLDEITNLVLLHPMCHMITIHENRMWARENGWIVTARGNPATVPVNLHNQRVVRLTRDGNYQQVAA